MDFVTDLPESTESGPTGISVISDRLKMMAIYQPCWNDIDQPELACLFFEDVICKHGIPDHIITDRGPQFTSWYWNGVYYHLSSDHWLSTAFNQLTDGQTERPSPTIGQYLRALCHYQQDNWVELLPLVQFAYSNSMHASTRITLFWAVHHRNRQMQFKAPNTPAALKSEIKADAALEALEETHQIPWENLLEAQQWHTKYPGGKEITCIFGDQVWLSTKHFRTARPLKKLDYQCTGPYTVSNVINKNSYKVDLSNTMRNHNVFHVSPLDRNAPPVETQPPSQPQPTIVDDSKEWEVDHVLDCKRRYRKLHYLVHWWGYCHICMSSEPAETLQNAHNMLEAFHRTHLEKPRRKWMAGIEFRDSGMEE